MNNLLDLSSGMRCEVLDFDKFLNQEFVYDIMDHGVVPGISLYMLENSPKSDKVIFSIGSTLISLRKKDAKLIYINLENKNG